MFHSTGRAGRWPLAITLMAAAMAACSDVPTATRLDGERRATFEVQTTDVPAVAFSVNETAVLDREAGTVRVAGGVACTGAARFEIRVSLLKIRKNGGTPRVLESAVLPQLDCSTSIAPWTAVLPSPKGLRAGATVTISVRTENPATPVEPTGLMTAVKLISDEI